MPRAVPMPLAKAYEFASANGLQAEADRIRRETTVHPGFRKGKQIRKAHLLDLFEERNLLEGPSFVRIGRSARQSQAR